MKNSPEWDNIGLFIIAAVLTLLAIIGFYYVIDSTTTGLITRWPI